MKEILFGISLMVFAIWILFTNLGTIGGIISLICAGLGLLISIASFFSSFENKK